MNGQTVTDKLNIAENYKTRYIQLTETNTFFTSPTSPEEVINIQDLKTSKRTGPNSLPQKIIKQIKKTISLPLSELINKTLAQGIFPSAFKTAKVVPIFKNESIILCNNFRPISLLSNVSKIIEKLMHKRLNKFLEQETCFYSLQFGFRLNCFTNNALMSIIESIQTQLIINMLQGFLLTWKKFLIQLNMIYSLKNWVIVLEGLQKTGSYLTWRGGDSL